MKSPGPNSRRSFLRGGGCLLAAAVLALPPALSGLPKRSVVGVGSGNERSYPLPGSDSVNIDFKAQVIVARSHNQVYAFSLACPHQQAAVKWIAKKSQFQCTKHDSHYQVDGVHVSGRATRNLDRFALRREGETLWVNLSRWFRSDQDPAGWNAAVVQI